MNLRHYAYIGDAVWELYVRKQTVTKTQNSNQLHKITTDKVKASYQADLMQLLEQDLTDLEKDIMRRARNLSIPVGRRSNQKEYRQATAFEALIGYWYYNNKEKLDLYLNSIKLFD